MASHPVLYVLDGHSLAHRAYHALGRREQLTTSSGEPVSAVYGFTRNLMEIIEKNRPQYITVAFDTGLSGRDALYAAYKAHRPDTPEDFEQQVERIQDVIRAFNIPIITQPGYEADDIIGTIAAQAETLGVDVCVVSGDGDILQLLSPQTKVLLRVRRKTSSGAFSTFDILYDEAQFEREKGIKPPQLIDLKGLMGDSSDNIPGVAGVGEKTATQLVQTYGSVEQLYERLDEVPLSQRKKLIEGRDLAFLSKQLATIQRDVPLTFDLQACLTSDFERSKIDAIFRELEFSSLINQLNKLSYAAQQQLPLFGTMFAEDAPAALVDTIIVDNEAELAALVESLNAASAIAFDTETTSVDQMQAELVGISLSVDGERGYYIPLGHRSGQQLPRQLVLDSLRPSLTNPNIPKYAHNASFDLVILQRSGINVAPITFDTMIAEWLLNPDSSHLGLKNLAAHRLGERMTEISSLIGKGSSQMTMDAIDIERVAPYAAADAVFTHRLVNFRKDHKTGELLEEGLRQELAQDAQLAELFNTLEMPLIPVLAAMERAGVLLNRAVLAELSASLSAQLAALEDEIYALDGVGRFNLNSPQQLSKLLFETLGLPVRGIAKTNYGYSTAAHVLEDLRDRSEQPIPIINLLLKYRELSKIKSTYVDALPALINPQTGRVHTSFNQTGASTGRLSSSNPNLQNIPIRTEQGREVRRAFIAPENMVLLSVDYSQIELRIVAHISQEPALLEAFANGQDIHASTAALVFNVPLEAVTKTQRSFAKRVNFGILYGMGAFRLARDSDLDLKEAENFINTYLARLPRVRQYLEETKHKAYEEGKVSTLFGRKRHFHIKGAPRQIAQRQEREAINMPIQGTAADVIKRAMIDLDAALAARRLSGRMLLQVHDELVLEVPERELEATARLVVSLMEGVRLPDGGEFNPRLKANAQYGKDWLDMESLF